MLITANDPLEGTQQLRNNAAVHTDKIMPVNYKCQKIYSLTINDLRTTKTMHKALRRIDSELDYTVSQNSEPLLHF